MHAQGQMIGWREYLRILHSTVYNFFDEEVPESADDKLQRYKNSSVSECSDPDYWHWVHFGGNKISWQIMWRTEIRYWRGPEIPLIKPTQQVTSNYERMCHYENIIDAISVLWCMLAWFCGLDFFHYEMILQYSWCLDSSRFCIYIWLFGPVSLCLDG